MTLEQKLILELKIRLADQRIKEAHAKLKQAHIDLAAAHKERLEKEAQTV